MPQVLMKHMRVFARQAVVSFGLLMIGSASVRAQQVAVVAVSESTSTDAFRDAFRDALPDAPGAPVQAVQASAPAQVDLDGGPQQTKRIAGIMPNFRSVSAGTVLPAQSAREKLEIAGHDTFDYSSFLIVAIQSGIAFNDKSYPEFHQGVMGYTRYYWHTFADTADENFMVGGLGPVIFHQDSRFYTLGHGGVVKRVTYAASRIAVSKSDQGRPMFNFSEVVGAGAAAGISSIYYPTVYRDWTKVGQKWLTSMIIDSANFTFKEYWPDINHRLFHSRKHNAAQTQ